MKKLGILVVVALAVLLPSAASAQIVGSGHDFSGASWNSGGQICQPCHTPHNAFAGLVPLWNHEDTAATFTLYSSGTLDASVGQPAGVSRACLSCHDGTVALDSFGGVTGTTNITGDALFSSDLSNDHPISFTYDNALAGTDGELALPATALSGLGGTIAADMLFAGSMECASCHDVHNTPGLPNMLIKPNAGSDLCLTCHVK